MSLKSQRVRVAAAGLAVLGLVAAGCGPSSGTSSADAETLVAYTGQAGDYQTNFNPYSPLQIGGAGTIFEPLFFFNHQAWRRAEAAAGHRVRLERRRHRAVGDLARRRQVDRRRAVHRERRRVHLRHAAQERRRSTRPATTARPPPSTTRTSSSRSTRPAFMEGPQILGRLWIVPEHLWKDVATPATDMMENPVGTGPFHARRVQAAGLHARSRIPDYWDGEPAVKKIRYLALSGNQAGADALKAGKVDWQTGPIPDIQNAAKNYPGYQAVTIPQNQMALSPAPTPSSAASARRPTRPCARRSTTASTAAAQRTGLPGDRRARSRRYSRCPERDKTSISGSSARTGGADEPRRRRRRTSCSKARATPRAPTASTPRTASRCR